jgi:H+-transporting ATPase
LLRSSIPIGNFLNALQEGISTIITAIRRSRMIFRRLETYIIYRMASSILILGFFFFAIITMTFEMPTWVLVLISLFNDLSVMATSFDKVRFRAQFVSHLQ